MTQNVIVPPFTTAPETVVGGTPQSVFPFEFPFWESADILVYNDGVLVDAADYTVVGLAIQSSEAVEGGYGSGTVTLDVAVSNVTITIDRLVVGDRDTQFSKSTPLAMPALNGDLNRLTARQQDLARLKMTRPAGARANKYVVFDANGNETLSEGTGADAGLRADLAASGGAALVGCADSGIGGVLRTLHNKLADALHVKDFGVTADGTTDDAAALQLAINRCALTGRNLNLGEGTIVVGSMVTGTSLANVMIFGSATIKGKAITDFQYLLDISNTTGVTLFGVTMDANGANRGAAVGTLSCLKANTTIRHKAQFCTFKNSLGISGASSVAVGASGGVLGLIYDKCAFLDCGTGPNTKSSDGLFVRGTFSTISNCYAENVTDHAFVLEGCEHSKIVNVTGKNCTSIAAMSNDGSADLYGNIISGVAGTCGHFGSFGGVVGAYTFSTGKLVDCIINNVNVRAASAATGAGPALFLYGLIDGMDVSNVTVSPGATSGKMSHAVLIDVTSGGVGVSLSRSSLRADAAGACVRIQNSTNNLRIDDCRLKGGINAISADGTSSFTERGNTFSGQSSTVINIGGSATFYGQSWQSWTPVFSSDLGDSATNFTATPTVNKSRINRVGNTVTLILNFDATLKAVSPAYIAFTVPSWAAPLDNNEWSTATVLNDVTWGTAEVRTITGGPLRIYRTGLVGFSSGANVSGRFVLSYEV